MIRENELLCQIKRTLCRFPFFLHFYLSLFINFFLFFFTVVTLKVGKCCDRGTQHQLCSHHEVSPLDDELCRDSPGDISCDEIVVGHDHVKHARASLLYFFTTTNFLCWPV